MLLIRNWVKSNPRICQQDLVARNTIRWHLTHEKSAGIFEDPTSKGRRFLIGISIRIGDISKSDHENSSQIFCGSDFKWVSVTVCNTYIMLFKKMFTILEVFKVARSLRQKPGLQLTEFPFNRSLCPN